MRITRGVIVAIGDLAREASPEEACGLLTGVDDVIDGLIPLRNAASTPQTKYAAASQDLFLAFRSIREAERRLLGIYHSHPRSDAYPSPTDVELAFYPEAIYLIASGLPEGGIRGFRIRDGEISEAPLEIVDVPNQR